MCINDLFVGFRDRREQSKIARCFPVKERGQKRQLSGIAELDLNTPSSAARVLVGGVNLNDPVSDNLLLATWNL